MIRARVDEGFHARFSAHERRYMFRLISRRAPLTHEAKLAWRIGHTLDLAAMREGARRLPARHDFTTFRSTSCQAKSPVKTLDELLGDKASLDADIFAYVRGRVVELGIEVLGVGVKDVILPGEMKDILNSVVQAEKAAQANVIRRREESNATRSLLNTARLIEESPVLMRLKELEALEKVTEKIDKLTVFGGLDGLLKQLVSLKT